MTDDSSKNPNDATTNTPSTSELEILKERISKLDRIILGDEDSEVKGLKKRVKKLEETTFVKLIIATQRYTIINTIISGLVGSAFTYFILKSTQ